MSYDTWLVNLQSPSLDNHLFSWTYDEMDAMMYDGYIYGYSKPENAFVKIDPLSGNRQTVKIHENPYVVFLFAGALDGCLLGEIGDGEDSYIRYLVNFDKQTMTPLTLETSGIKVAPLPILAEYESMLLVITGYTETDYIGYDKDGNPYETTSYMNREAFISKDDYLHSVPNYYPIASIVSAE